jgi:peptidoglycan hydrolase CwlO-like protein
MEICSSEHDEICYESHFCPVCAIKEDTANEINALDDEISSLRADIDSLMKENDELLQRITQLESELSNG